MIPANQLTALVDGSTSGGLRQGKAQFMLNRIRNEAGAGRQVQFLRDVIEQKPAGTKSTYDHPASRAARMLGKRDTGPLTSTEVTWLNGLPSEPADVSHDDAALLAALAAKVPAKDHPIDASLVNARWAPVQAHHDAKAAATELANIDREPVTVPSSALGAVADAVADEQPALNSSEAIGRARQLLDDAALRRSASLDQRRNSARERTGNA